MIKEFKFKFALKEVTTMNRHISTVTYFESRPLTSRPLTSCPHLRKVSILRSGRLILRKKDIKSLEVKV